MVLEKSRYQSLYELILRTNRVFSPILLLLITFNCFNISVTISQMVVDMENFTVTRLAAFLFYPLNRIVHFVFLVFICLAAEGVYSELNLYANTVFSSNAKLSASGFAYIDYKLLLKIWGVALTYVFVVVQYNK